MMSENPMDPYDPGRDVGSYWNWNISIPPDMMIQEASGLVARSSSHYFDQVSKVALPDQGRLLKQMTEDPAFQDVSEADRVVDRLIADMRLDIERITRIAEEAMKDPDGGISRFDIGRIDAAIHRVPPDNRPAP